jgi:hypothetical protein
MHVSEYKNIIDDLRKEIECLRGQVMSNNLECSNSSFVNTDTGNKCPHCGYVSDKNSDINKSC